MRETYNALAADIIERESFKKDYETLFKAYILHLIDGEYTAPTREIGFRLSKTAQILVVSDHPDNIDMGVRIIDMFMELNPPYLEDLLIIGAAAFSHLGNYPNVTLINNRWNNRKQISFSLDRDLADEMHKDINMIESLGIEATNFQVDLWANLQEGKDIVTIAPTSTGKSYIIMQYIIQRMIDTGSDKAYSIYIVPTRALIYEVSKKIQNILFDKEINNIDVATIAQRGKEYNRKTIFILTQERMLMLLHFQKLMQFSYIVIDEAQNIAEGSRGVLLHIALSSVINKSRQLQLIFSTPSTNYEKTFDYLFGKDKLPICKTEHTPVSKNIIHVKFEKNNLILKSVSPVVEVKIPTKFSNGSYAEIVKILGATKNNIVFANTKRECEKIVSQLLKDVAKEKPELDAAADYIAKTVHAEYSLVKAIKKGIAFHYGPLPRHIRIMIENYVEEGLIDYIVCTSTLAEGVNMPAQNLFIRDPKTITKRGIPASPMSQVRFRNIIGRAGRLMKHFSGNVFYVDYDKWDFKDTIEDHKEDHKLPTYFKILKDNTDDIINAMSGKKMSGTLEIYAVNATINKILQDTEEGNIEPLLDEYLDKRKKRMILGEIDKLRNSIDIPPAIRILNPTVGIVQQNMLYKYLYSLDNIMSLWPVHPKDGNFLNYLSKQLPLLIEYDFIQIVGYNSTEATHKYYRKICAVADSWVKGKPVKEIIENFIKWRKSEKRISIDAIVKDIIVLLDDVIRFRLANAVKCFYDIYVFVAEQKGLDIDKMPEIYSALEIGACDKIMIVLISIGLSRQTAIEVSHVMHNIDIERSDILHQINKHPKYSYLHIITRKEIESLQR